MGKVSRPQAPAPDESAPGMEAGAPDAPELVLLELERDLYMVYGPVPAGLELVDASLVPRVHKERLAQVVTEVGGVAAVAGGVADALAQTSGMYRLSPASKALLDGGANLVAKGGSNLGTIMKDGKIIAQARLVPMTLSGARLAAAVGPAIALCALQAAVGEVAKGVRQCVETSSLTLEVLRDDQLAELKGLVRAVLCAREEMAELGYVDDTTWDTIASSGTGIFKQIELSKEHLSRHSAQLRKSLGAKAKNGYLLGAEGRRVQSDVAALFHAVQAYVDYELIRAARASVRHDEANGRASLFDKIVSQAPDKLCALRQAVQKALHELVIELRIAAECPAGVSASIGSFVRDKVPGAARLASADESCKPAKDLLGRLSPFLDACGLHEGARPRPDLVISPQGQDVEEYVRRLGWHLEPEEVLRALAFVTVPGQDRDLVALTSQRLVLVSGAGLRDQGRLSPQAGVGPVCYVHPRAKHQGSDIPTLTVCTDTGVMTWQFPPDADVEQVDRLAQMLQGVEGCAVEAPQSQELAAAAR